MNSALSIYEKLGTGKDLRRYKDQIYNLYRYFALFNRMENKFADAVKWYNTILEFAKTNKITIDNARYMQEIAYCYNRLGEHEKAMSHLEKAESMLKGYTDEQKKYKLKVKFFGIGPFSLPL
jgi:tetratricopeptide (TPR) repeat protein